MILSPPGRSALAETANPTQTAMQHSTTTLSAANLASLRLFGEQMARRIRTAVDAADLPAVGDHLDLSLIHDGVAYFTAHRQVAPFSEDIWTCTYHFCDADAWTAHHAPEADDDDDLGAAYEWACIQAERANEVALFGDWS